MSQGSLRRTALVSSLTLALAACGTMGPPTASPPGPTPTPRPKPDQMVPAEFSQRDAETACLLQGSRKFAVPLSGVAVTSSKPVDAGYLVKLNFGGTERSCIIAKDGFVRSLR